MNIRNIVPTVVRINAKPDDHRRWKKLLRLCAENGRSTPRTERTDPCMTTAVDAAARQCVRRHRNKTNQGE